MYIKKVISPLSKESSPDTITKLHQERNELTKRIHDKLLSKNNAVDDIIIGLSKVAGRHPAISSATKNSTHPFTLLITHGNRDVAGKQTGSVKVPFYDKNLYSKGANKQNTLLYLTKFKQLEYFTSENIMEKIKFGNIRED